MPTEKLEALVRTWQRVEPNADHTALLVELLENRKLNTLLVRIASDWRSSNRVEPGLMDVLAEMVRGER